MVAAGRLGRKTGRGYYEYAEDGAYRPDDPEPPAARRRRGHARLRSSATGRWRTGSASARGRPGFELREGGPAELVVDAGAAPADALARRAARRCSRSAPPRSLAARGEPGAVGFHLLPPLDDARLVELTRAARNASAFAAEAAEELLRDGSASTPSGSTTRPASCSAGSSASS